MTHHCATFVLLAGSVLGLAPLARADEEEPTFADKKLSHWLGLLTDGKDAKARRRGVLAVEQIGHSGSRKVVPALVKALREDKEPVVRAAAARAAGRVAARALEQARADKKEELPRFDNVRDALGTALRTEKAEAVREAAALALGDLGGEARGVVGTLGQALKDKHAATVKAAAQTLRRMGRDARDAQLELQTLLADKKADVEARTDAALALGQIRPDVTQALPVLREALADEKSDERVRKAVAESLGRLGKEGADASSTLATVLVSKDSSPELRLAVVTALDQFGADAKGAIPSLVRAVGDAGLVKSMGDNGRFIRPLAMHALGRMGKDLDKDRKEAVTAILKASEDPNVEVCVSALETLGALGLEGLGSEVNEVVKKLDTVLLREGRKSVREAAQAARDKLQPKKK